MASYGHLYSSYFKGSDFTTEPVDFTIIKAVPEKVGKDDEKKKLVVYVKEDPRGIVLNSGRYKALVEIFGDDDVDKWAGGKIKCFQVKQQFAGKVVNGFAISA
jgi:hypothetical protein